MKARTATINHLMALIIVSLEQIRVRLRAGSTAVQVDRCGESGSGSAVCCAAVTRLPSKGGATVLTVGHYDLYDIHDGKNMTTTQDGNFNLPNAGPGLHAHELAHVDQWEEFGTDFIWDYLNDPETWERSANDASPPEVRGKCS